MSVVVDASMAIAWVLEDEQSEPADAVMRRVVSEGAVVPSLWKLEVANALRGAVRVKRCDERYAAFALSRIGRLPIVVDDETDGHAWGRTFEFSREHRLTVYDTAYLELALRRELALATCDRDLAKAARRAGVQVILG